MIWIFATVALLLVVYNPGFRKFLAWVVAVAVAVGVTLAVLR